MKITGALSFRQGLAWVRINGRGVGVHAPWHKPLFSERSGLPKIVRVLGFCFEALRPLELIPPQRTDEITPRRELRNSQRTKLHQTLANIQRERNERNRS